MGIHFISEAKALEQTEPKRICSAAGAWLTLSRPRFWLYLGGTYLIGFAAGASRREDFLSPEFWAFLLYFLLPANLLLYGINDLCDRDTDARNPKKGAQEHLLSAEEDGTARTGVILALLAGLALMAILHSGTQRVLFAAFLVLAFAYSAPPLRLKARPFLDSLSNMLYALPAFLAYHQAAGRLPSVSVMLAGMLWTAAMHLFSAVPDSRSDREAGLSTTATVLGQRGALFLCLTLWASCLAILALNRVLWPWSILASVYVVIPAYVIFRPTALKRAYWLFPVVNGLGGMLAFFVLGARL
jgi:lycopene elongase/hydratase (dihydrobisanhydrobacterioruberin-forming)